MEGYLYVSSPTLARSRERSGQQRTARACVQCKAAKAKCAFLLDHRGTCERCSRHMLECMISNPAVRRPRTSRTAKLEQKLDNIVTLLKDSRSQQPPQSQSQGDGQNLDSWPLETNITSPSSVSQHFNSTLESIVGGPAPQVQDPNSAPQKRLPSASQRETWRFGYQLSQEDVSRHLDLFRTEMTSYFPFVVIPPSTTVEQLYLAKPLLLKTIVLATSRPKVATQSELGKDILESLSTRLLRCGEKSLELLQSLLVYIAWGNYSFHKNAQTTFLLQLAVGLLIELGLDKMPRGTPDRHKSLVDAVETSPSLSETTSNNQEGRRAYVGCFYLSSIIVQCSKKMSALRQTPYLEQCCKILSETAEYSTDSFLVSLVRLQALATQGAYGISFDETGSPLPSSASTGMYIKYLQQELQSFQPLLQENTYQTSLTLHYHSASITLLEIGLFDPHPSTTDPTQKPAHINQLFSCLTATKNYISTWFQLPIRIFAHLPFTTWAQLANAIIVSSRLLLYEQDGWDLEQARSIADFGSVLESIAARIEEAARGSREGAEGEAEHDGLGVMGGRVRWVRVWYEKYLRGEGQWGKRAQVPRGGGEVAAPAPALDEREVMNGNFLCLDDVPWQQFVDEWGNLLQF